MQYKIISFDLDGTLLDTNMTLSDENRRALTILSEKGVQTVVNSGRTLTEIPDCIRTHPAFRYIIHSNGSVILDQKTKTRYTECMSRALSDRVLNILREYDTLITLHVRGDSYIDARYYNDTSFLHYQTGDYFREHLYATNKPLENFSVFSRTCDEIEMIFVLFHDDRELELCRERLLATGETTVVSSAPHDLEIFSKKAGKGNALLRLADLLGVDSGATLAIGDTENDAEMLRKAGLGVAIRNACTLLKNEADTVADCSNDEHIAQYLLQVYC